MRECTAQGAQQQAFANQELFAGSCAVVVMAITGELFGYIGVEGHIEKFRAVLQAAKVFCLDETGASVIAFIAEDAVQFQRMTDGFVDLQHHLVGHQQQIAWTLRRVRCQQQLQRLVGDQRAGTDQAAAADHIRATLLAEILATQAAGLAVVTVVGGDIEARVDEALGLAQFGAGAVEVDLLDVGDAEADLPAHQALVLGHGGGFGPQQLIAVAQGGERLVEGRREIVGTVAGNGVFAQVQQGMGLESARLLFGAFEGGLQALLRQVVGCRIGFDAIDSHGQHRAFVAAQARRFGDVLAHRQVLAGLAHITQGKEFGARAQGSKALLELGVEIEHSGTSLVWSIDVARGG